MSELIPSLADVLAKHRLDTSCGWKEGAPGFHAWCRCGWHSPFGVPEAEIKSGVQSPTGLGWHDEHVQDAYWAARTVHDRETLDALPFLTLVRGTWRAPSDGACFGPVWERVREGRWNCIAGGMPSDPVELPVRVLWLPGEGEQK